MNADLNNSENGETNVYAGSQETHHTIYFSSVLQIRVHSR